MALNEILDAVSSVPLWSILLVIVLTTLYHYSTRNFDYWQKQGVKVSKPWPFMGSISFFKMQNMDEFDLENYKKHGRIFGFYMGNAPMLMVAEPELLRKILVKDFHVFRNRQAMDFIIHDKIMKNMLSVLKDDEWKGVRNIITPTFTTGKLKQMIKLIEECALQLINHLKKIEKDGKPFEARHCCTSFTIDVIATCTFGTKINSLENPDNEFLKNATKVFKSFLSKWFILVFFSKTLFELLSPYVMPDNKLKYFANILEEIIESRKKEQEPRKDFLQLLLEAEYGDDKETENSEEKWTPDPSNKKILSRTQVLSQAITFLIAGSETTAITFCLTLYNLALNEDCQEKLIQEIDTILQNNEESLSYDVIAQMQYLDMVISETLRMYPPLARFERGCEVNEYNVTENIVLKKGMQVGIPVYAMHYDEEFYPNPHQFDPERFSPENRNKRDPYTYLPFGYGPRNCIGMRFALMELKIGLIYLLKEFRVKKCPETKVMLVKSASWTHSDYPSINMKQEVRFVRNPKNGSFLIAIIISMSSSLLRLFIPDKIPFERDMSIFIQPKSLYFKLENRK